VLYIWDTNIGNIRPKNEDAFVLKEVWEGSHLLAVVVDCGGNGGGDVASDLAVRCISEHFRECMHSINSIDILQSAVIFANNSIYVQHYNPWLSQMSCVLTTAYINIGTGQTIICHVGDTRLYTLRKGVFTKIISDRSLIGPLEGSGQIPELGAMYHPAVTSLPEALVRIYFNGVQSISKLILLNWSQTRSQFLSLVSVIQVLNLSL